MAGRKRVRGSVTSLTPEKHRVKVFVGYVPDPERPYRKRRKYVTETVYGPKSAAEARLAVLLSLKHNRPQKLISSSIGARAYFQDWLDNIDPLNVRASTHRAHVSMMNTYVLPAFGDRQLRNISTADIDGLIQGLLKAGKSASTVRYCVSMLSRAFDKATKLYLIQDNPVKNATRPKLGQSKNAPYDDLQLLQFLTAALEFRLHAVLMVLLATTSLRPSEAFALRWSDVDLWSGIVQVSRSLVRFKGGYTFEAPKTARGRRGILLSPHTTYLLAAWYAQCLPASPESLVFPNTTGEPLHIAYVYHGVFEKVVERAGLPKRRMYDLRHSHATVLAANEVSPRVVSERLGHASSALTLDVYTGVSAKMQQSAADATEDMFGRQFQLQRPRRRVGKAMSRQQKLFDAAYWAFVADLTGSDKRPRRLEDLLPD